MQQEEGSSTVNLVMSLPSLNLLIMLDYSSHLKIMFYFISYREADFLPFASFWSKQ